MERQKKEVLKRRFKGLLALLSIFIILCSNCLPQGVVLAEGSVPTVEPKYYMLTVDYEQNLPQVNGQQEKPEWFRSGDIIETSGIGFHLRYSYVDSGGQIQNYPYTNASYVIDGGEMNGSYFSGSVTMGSTIPMVEDCDFKASYTFASASQITEPIQPDTYYASSIFMIISLQPYRRYEIVYNNQFGDMEQPQTSYATGHDGIATTLSLPSEMSTPGDNYTLAGFSLSADKSTLDFTPNQSVMSLSQYETDGVVNLYPVWKEKVEAAASSSVQTGSAKVSMPDFYYGNTSVSPSVTSATNDVSKALLYYKSSAAGDNTYTQTKPSSVGTYVVKAVLPESNGYSQAEATDTFTISYLPMPAKPYEIISASTPNGREQIGWYSSAVEIKPALGYQISWANENSFKDSITVDQGNKKGSFRLRKRSTGECTDATAVVEINIDTDAPQMELTNNQSYYVNEEKKAQVPVEQLSSLILDGKELTLSESKELIFKEEPKPRQYTLMLCDKAGNLTTYKFRICPAWMESKIVPEGEVYLEAGVEYQFGEGMWMLETNTNQSQVQYMENENFYAAKEGYYVFHKKSMR